MDGNSINFFSEWKMYNWENANLRLRNIFQCWRVPASLHGNDYDNSTIMVFNGISPKPNNELSVCSLASLILFTSFFVLSLQQSWYNFLFFYSPNEFSYFTLNVFLNVLIYCTAQQDDIIFMCSSCTTIQPISLLRSLLVGLEWTLNPWRLRRGSSNWSPSSSWYSPFAGCHCR